MVIWRAAQKTVKECYNIIGWFDGYTGNDAPQRIGIFRPILGQFVDVIPILRITILVADLADYPTSETEWVAHRQGHLALGVGELHHRHSLNKPTTARRNLL